MQNITPCLWFDDQAEEAANFYTSIFKNSKIKTVSRYGETGKEFHKKPVGSAMTVVFEINGQEFTALNGGPMFKFSEAISFQVMCDSQEEVDHFWEKLTSGGGQESQCGWLKDKFGVSWQIIPVEFLQLMKGPNAQQVMQAMFSMKKLDLNTLRRAAEQR
jgi:predicted 3-demethylubiquinone-9 3-methyltransferase (glyoxalase superfamily)